MSQDTIGIDNAPWWLPHSHVLIKEDLLAEDQEWINNQVNHVVAQGTPQAHMTTRVGSAPILLIKRMVVQGVVAVKRSNDRVKTVNLPHEANLLLAQDLEYIATKITELNTPMTPQEQADFLPSVNGHAGEHLNPVK